MLVLYVAGQAVDYVLLAIALWRRRATPPSAAALAVAGLAPCALTLRRGAVTPSPAATSAPLTPTRT